MALSFGGGSNAWWGVVRAWRESVGEAGQLGGGGAPSPRGYHLGLKEPLLPRSTSGTMLSRVGVQRPMRR